MNHLPLRREGSDCAPREHPVQVGRGVRVHTNAHLIERFYTAFQKRDGDGMAACYAPDVKFTDEVFVGLEGERAKAMWKMLCARAKDLTVEFRDVQASDTEGSAHW